MKINIVKAVDAAEARKWEPPKLIDLAERREARDKKAERVPKYDPPPRPAAMRRK